MPRRTRRLPFVLGFRVDAGDLRDLEQLEAEVRASAGDVEPSRSAILHSVFRLGVAALRAKLAAGAGQGAVPARKVGRPPKAGGPAGGPREGGTP
jgi:hypothetical protein